MIQLLLDKLACNEALDDFVISSVTKELATNSWNDDLLASEPKLLNALPSIETYINSEDTRGALLSMATLSWIMECYDELPQSVITSLEKLVQASLLSTVKWLTEHNYDCLVMSLFLWSICNVEHFNKDTGEMVISTILEKLLFSDNSMLSGTTTGTGTTDSACLIDKQKYKVQHWSYRAVINITRRHGASVLSSTQFSSLLVERAHTSVWGALGDPVQRGCVVHPSAAGEVEQSVQNQCRMYSVQLELLSLLPLSTELLPLYTATLETLPCVTTTISEALKRSKAAEETVLACCLLWKVTVRICAVLLLPAPTTTTTPMNQALGTASERKERFMNFLAPKAGVGVLAVPLQLILKRSRLHAALCYRSLAQSLTAADSQAWYEPASVLKLLLRCLYHILCVAPTASSRATTPIAKRNREGEAGAEPPDAYCCPERENANMRAVAVAAEALVLLCTHISAKQLASVPYISVSLGRTGTAATAGAATAVSERSSIDILIRHLLYCWHQDTTTAASSSTRTNTTNAVTEMSLQPLPSQLQTVLKVCAGVQCFSILCANLCSTVHTPTPCSSSSNITCDEKTLRRAGYYPSGLFGSSISIENHAMRDGLAPDRVDISAGRVFEYVRKIASAGCQLVQVHALYTTIQQNVEMSVIDRILVDCVPECSKQLTSLMCAWQACVLKLTQSLLQEHALLRDDHLCSVTCRHDSAIIGTSTAAAVASGAHTYSQQQQCGNAVYRHSPHLFAFSSQMSQQLCAKQRQHQLSQRPSIAHGSDVSPPSLPLEGDPASQLPVLCSAHPPAVQATVDLLNAAVQMWRNFWLGSELGHSEHHSRAMFVEALWWFLDHTSCFSVEAAECTLTPLREVLQQQQPWLRAEVCPENAAGLVMLLTLSHAGLCHQHLPTTASDQSSDYVSTIQRAQQRCLNGLTEAGVLPGLFAWLPRILVGSAQASPQCRQDSDTQKVILCMCCVNAPADDGGELKCPTVTRLLSHFLALSLHQLSSMTVPSLSEQQSPALMHTMIAGLGDLVVAPLVMAVLGRGGLGTLLLDRSEASLMVLSSLPLAESPVLSDWKKILQLWLELRVSALRLGLAEDSTLAVDDTGRVETEEWLWARALLQPHTALSPCIPVQCVAWEDEGGGRLQTRFCDVYAALLFAQEALDTSIRHCRACPHSKQTHPLCATACAILVSCVSSFRSLSVGTLQSEILRSADAVFSKILVLVSALHAHLSGLGATLIYCQHATATIARPSQAWTFAVFRSVFTTIAALIEEGDSRSSGDPADSALKLKFHSQWTLAAVSALCTVHTNTLHGGKQAGFRPASATLTLSAEFRSVLRDFLGAFTPAKLGEELWDFASNAWVELGGEAGDIEKVRHNKSTSNIAAAIPKPESFNSPQPTAASVAAVSVGQKRSFAVLSTVYKASPAQPPVPPHIEPTAQKVSVPECRAPDSAYLKVSVPSQELHTLVARTAGGARVRQGLVPATYTAADRANLDQQSQALSQALSSQQTSQRSLLRDSAETQLSASSAAPGVLQQQLDASSAAIQTTAAASTEKSKDLQHLRTHAVSEGQQQQSHYAQAQQEHFGPCTESTTCISPSPALSAGAARRVQTGYFHSRYASTTTVTAEAEPAVSLAQDMLNEANPIAPGLNAASPVAPGLNDASPIAPGLHDASPVAPGLNDASPIAPGLNDASPVAPGLNDASPIAPGLNDASPIAPGLNDASPIAPEAGVGVARCALAATTGTVEAASDDEERQAKPTGAALAAVLQSTQITLQNCIRRVATALPEPPQLDSSSSSSSTGIIDAESEGFLARTLEQSHELTGLLITIWNRHHNTRNKNP